jgi:hypothetical protein
MLGLLVEGDSMEPIKIVEIPKEVYFQKALEDARRLIDEHTV